MRELGHMLREARVANNLDLSDISRKTRISGFYLSAMEEGKFHVIPKFYDRGYLKLYASILNMDVTPILALYDSKQKETTAQHPRHLA